MLCLAMLADEGLILRRTNQSRNNEETRRDYSEEAEET